MKWVEKTARRVIEVCGILGAVVLAGMMLFVVADVLLRYLFDAPIHGSSEIIVEVMVVVAFLGLGTAALRGEHISVDVISGKLSRRGRIILDVFNYVIVFIYGSLIVSQSFGQALIVKNLNMKSTTIGIPRFPFVMMVTFGTILLLLAVLVLLYNVRNDTEVDGKEPF